MSVAHANATNGFASRIVMCLSLMVVTSLGCRREFYRLRADQDAYALTQKRLIDPRWNLPARCVEPDAQSRLADPTCPDAIPIPPDDPAARTFQVTAGRPREFHDWCERGWLNSIEYEHWKATLPTDAQGKVKLNQETALQLAVLHSRDYQSNVEDVYLNALNLSLAQFEFDLQAGSRHGAFFTRSGASSNRSNRLDLANSAQLQKNLQSGGQFVMDLANSLVFEYSGNKFNAATSSLLVAFTQPLLRGAFARIRTQQLSEAERSLLYQVRDFARFRRDFYVSLAGRAGFLGLLTQLQEIRNLEANLETLERNLNEHEALVRAQMIPQFQRDQVFQQNLQVRTQLLAAQADLQTSLDAFKNRLGLPPNMALGLDETPLKQFELTSSSLDTLRKENDRLNLSLLQFERMPPNATLSQGRESVDRILEQANKELKDTKALVDRWEKSFNRRNKLASDEIAKLNRKREKQLLTDVIASLKSVQDGPKKDRARSAELKASLAKGSEDAQWKSLRDLVSKDVRSRLADIFVAQTQARVFLIELEQVELSEELACQLAIENRLDIMNAQARVTDAWRQVEVAANRLKGDLNFRYESLLGTDPDKDGVFRFDASASRHRFGLQFDTPLNRRAERNEYRTRQIAYQRARREYMATKDRALNQIRLDLRDLQQNRRQFEISRDQLVTAARQVDEAEFNVRTQTEANSSVTLYLLTALQSLLASRNQLIGNWVNYETSRMSLYRDLDLMDIDGRGNWSNEQTLLSQIGSGDVEMVSDPEEAQSPGKQPADQPNPKPKDAASNSSNSTLPLTK